MHRVEMLERLLAQAAGWGYIVRQEWLGGRGGGLCEMRGQKYLFVDLALNVAEQLGQITEALQGEPSPLASFHLATDRPAVDRDAA